jgi:hypothetical protein
MRDVFLAALVSCAICGGCGGSTAIQTAAPISTWAGTYTGNLDFNGCPSSTSCGGDAVTITISEAPDGTGFSPTLTVTGMDNTKNEAITGTGTALYDGAAPAGGGSEDTNANATITPGGSIVLLGSGQSASGPVLIQTIAVHNTSTVNGAIVSGPLYFGTLTRQN